MTAHYSSLNHDLVEAIKWDPAESAERVTADILLSKGTSNSYLIQSPDGDVVVNTGTSYQGARHRSRYEELLGRKLNVRKIIFTQSHADHMGGWRAFADSEVEIIAQANYPDGRIDRCHLASFYLPRLQRIVGDVDSSPQHRDLDKWWNKPDEAPVSILFETDYSFVLGGRSFELHSTPSGETTDCCTVWLPDEKALFTGNFMGALYGALPHLYTLRGDRLRSARRFIRDMDYIIGLKPHLLITGHGAPISGGERICADLTRIRDAVAHIHDQTIAGMNQHKDLPLLMREITLPASLTPRPGRGPVSWLVRTIWEESAGWFRQERTTELYATPPSAIWKELVALAGGPEPLVRSAEAQMAKNDPIKALHFTEMVLFCEPHNKGALKMHISALEELVSRTEGKTFDELAWLEGEIRAARDALVQ